MSNLGIAMGILTVIAVIVLSLIISRKFRAKWNNRDSEAATVLEDGIEKFHREGPTLITSPIYGVRTYSGFRLGEVTRHFDVNTSATIQGWMTHDMKFAGWGVGASLGRSSLGIGSIGLSGTSQVSLTSSGINRDNLMGDGFIAVLEKPSDRRVELLRLVVPSENETREWVGQWINEFPIDLFAAHDGFGKVKRKNGKLIPYFRKCYASFERNASELLRFKDEVSYVSDRLNSILRMPIESRPDITVYGEPISEHAILGAAIRFGDEEKLIPLFPITLIKFLPQNFNQTLEVLKGQTPIKSPANQ
jgi:hypothetical protein